MAATFLACLPFLSGAAPAGQRPAGERGADESILRAMSQAFVDAFNQKDAKAIAGQFADDARVVDPKGGVVEGREAIEALFAALFAARPETRLVEARIDAIRFLTNDVAIEDGYTKVLHEGGRAEAGGYTILYARKEGSWKVAEVRDHVEMPDDLTFHERLAELEWLVGDWIDESDGAVVHTVCRWSEDGNYLLRNYTMRIGDRNELSGTQRIGWDPQRHQIRSWVFDSNGGFGEGFWSRLDERTWLVKSSGVLKDGDTATTTQRITRERDHSMSWVSMDQTRGEDAVPTTVVVRMVKRPPSPGEDTAGRAANTQTRKAETQP